MNVRSAVRAHLGATLMGTVAVLGIGGVATAAVVVSPASSTGEVFEEPETTEPAATTTTAPEPEPAPVVEPPVIDAPAATVEDVTPPEPVPAAAAPEPAPAVDAGIGTTGADGRYTPAPPRQNPGEPPVIDNASSGADGELLPGEPGYVPPGG